jgi:hypothetical protein
MQYLAWALHMLTDDALGADRRARMLSKLAHHGNLFIDLALLNRDYWGGSLLQDHGRKSFMAFGIAALNLYGVIPQAERWLTYTLPRIRRSLDATRATASSPPAAISPRGCISTTPRGSARRCSRCRARISSTRTRTCALSSITSTTSSTSATA